MRRNSAHGWTSKDQRRRAVVAVQVAVMMTAIIGFVALTVDVGMLYNAAADTQRTVDSAALAGAGVVPQGDLPARVAARAYVHDNPIFKQALAPECVGVDVGYWSGSLGQFVSGSVLDRVAHNAVRVAGAHDQNVYFARVLGFGSQGISRDAVAVSGGGVCAGIWGLEGVLFDGDVVVDSYDSTAGSYGGLNRNANGDVCSCEDIIINGGIEIWGDAMYGEGYALTTYGSSYNIYGSVNEHNCTVTPFQPDFHHASWDNDNASVGLTSRDHDPFNGTQWDFYLTGQETLTLNPGRYYFTSAMIDGQAQLFINGPVEIYVDGPGDFAGGGIVNATQDPKDLTIYVSGDTLHLTGAGGFYGAVHAPQATIFLDGGGEYYGTILGQTIDSDGNATVHVDETLVQQLYGLEVSAPVLVQ